MKAQIMAEVGELGPKQHRLIEIVRMIVTSVTLSVRFTHDFPESHPTV